VKTRNGVIRAAAAAEATTKLNAKSGAPKPKAKAGR
jgi:hypothetical protein